jgi:hypothetical protein
MGIIAEIWNEIVEILNGIFPQEKVEEDEHPLTNKDLDHLARNYAIGHGIGRVILEGDDRLVAKRRHDELIQSNEAILRELQKRR